MIKVYRKNSQDKILERLDDYPASSAWIHVISPTSVEIDELCSRLDIPLDFVVDPLDVDERSRIEVDEDGFLIVYRVPVYQPEHEFNQFSTIPVGIILKKDYIITVCTKELPMFEDFINQRIRNFFTSKRSRFVVQLFHVAIRNYLGLLKDISKKITVIEREFYETQKNETLITLKNIEKSLYVFATSLKGNEILKERIMKFEPIRMYDEEKELLEDILIENTQAIEMANMYAYNLKSLEDHFYSIISNHLNNVMKFLTSITLVLMLPTLVSSIYGMNVKLPLQNNPYAFWFLVGGSIVITGIVTALLFKRKWF